MTGSILETSLDLAQILLTLTIVAAFVRMARGPSLADRVVALDVIAATIVTSAVLYALKTGLAVFIDVALTIALIAFLGTIALAHAIESGAER